MVDNRGNSSRDGGGGDSIVNFIVVMLVVILLLVAAFINILLIEAEPSILPSSRLRTCDATVSDGVHLYNMPSPRCYFFPDAASTRKE